MVEGLGYAGCGGATVLGEGDRIVSFEFDIGVKYGVGIGTKVGFDTGTEGVVGIGVVGIDKDAALCAGEDGEFGSGPETLLRCSGGCGATGGGRTLGDIAGVLLRGISGTRQICSGI